ncbi:YebG family protein [Sodalis sp. RH22]|uniref:YebG family protein n=1 Tax=unclassified Sodalis (in: enterobacteria) TaxID=2636512 RepID=UPI0039B4D07F
MAIETKYVVVRKGEEKMTFASKKEAEAYDKMLDMAEAFSDWLLTSGMPLDEPQAEKLGLYLAEHKDDVQHILRTSKLPEAIGAQAPADESESMETDGNADAGTKKIRAVKAA